MCKIEDVEHKIVPRGTKFNARYFNWSFDAHKYLQAMDR